MLQELKDEFESLRGPSNSDGDKVVVTDIDMKFGSMVLFMVKWAVASIPAVIILVVLGFAAFVMLGFLGMMV